MVLFTSDNGPHAEGGYDPEVNDSNGPLRGIKRDLYEGGIRVPLIVHWPGHARMGEVTSAVGSFWDLLPTFAEAAGTSAPKVIDGQFILAAFESGSTGADDRPLYWEFHEGANSQQAARIGRWKAIRKVPDGPLEIYDLAQDLDEEQNVAGTHLEIVEQMKEYFATARTENPIWKIRHPGEPRPRGF
jgi:arylsulfatase A